MFEQHEVMNEFVAELRIRTSFMQLDIWVNAVFDDEAD